jgi:hypothetical protein
MYDEMQVTRPDRLFGRVEVDSMCGMCHERHEDAMKVETFRKRWLGKTRPNGRLIKETSICTDCHGSHNYIPKEMKSNPVETSWTSLFNGRDLETWEAPDGSVWSVKAARLNAVPDTDKQPSMIVTRAEYADFQISITFRANWPMNAWVSLRQLKHISGPHVAIFDSSKPFGRPGSIWLPDKKLALANLREESVDRLTWNTMLIEARRNEYSTWLNGHKIGSVHIDGPPRGKIAINVADHPENKDSRLQISEAYIRPLSEASEKGNK